MHTQDLAECRRLLRDGSRSFSLAALALPAGVRQRATALYAFCRIADDAVDSGGGFPAIAGLRERLDQAYAGQAREGADRAFAMLVAGEGVPREVFDALIEGFTWDAGSRRYADMAALRAYAFRVAGTVGIAMAILMGARSREALARACDLGVAMQLTNIARDVGEDARAGRLYLPLQWLRAEGIDPEAWLAAPEFNPGIARVVSRLLRAADAIYARADSGIALLPRGCRPAIRAARHIYAGIGRELERQGLDSVSRRAIVPAWRKLALLARAALGSSAPALAHAAPLPEAAGLIRAVARGAPEAAPLLPPPAPAGGLDERISWLVTLFDRLQREDQAGWRRAGARP
jgi:phytoene synthase